MLKWIGGMQAFMLVMVLIVASSFIGVYVVITGYDNSIYPWFVYFSLLVFGAYALIMTVWVMPAIKKEKEEKRKKVLEENKETVDMYVTSLKVFYKSLIVDLSKKGNTKNDILIILNEIYSQVGIPKKDSSNEK